MTDHTKQEKCNQLEALVKELRKDAQLVAANLSEAWKAAEAWANKTLPDTAYLEYGSHHQAAATILAHMINGESGHCMQLAADQAGTVIGDLARGEHRPEQHPDDTAVDRFAAAMKEKLAKKRAEGRGGWDDRAVCTAEYLSKLLRAHVAKDDPLDVGNFAMMLHQRGERITPAEPEQTAWPECYQPVFVEIQKAVAKFPTWPTDPLHALAVVGEEFGELTKSVLQSVYEPHKTSPEELTTEAVQTAAMALRFFQSLSSYDFTKCEQHTQDRITTGSLPFLKLSEDEIEDMARKDFQGNHFIDWTDAGNLGVSAAHRAHFRRGVHAAIAKAGEMK
jgi:hypothetical protein